MRTAFVIIKRPVIILPPLARLCQESYLHTKNHWTCVIDCEDIFFHFNIKCDFLVRRHQGDLKKLALDLAIKEGKCDRVIIVNFGDRCEDGYLDRILLNSVGISHLCECEGEVMEEKEFSQKDSFICLSCSDPGELIVNNNLNVFIGQPASTEDLNRYNLDCK